MKYYLLLSVFIVLSCADDVSPAPTFRDKEYDFKFNFSFVDSNYNYIKQYVDSIHYKFVNIGRTDSLSGSLHIPTISSSIEKVFNDSLFIKDTIHQYYILTDVNGSETFYLKNLADSQIVNVDGEAIDFTIPLKRYSIKEHRIINKSSYSSDLIDSIFYSYIHFKENIALDTISGSGDLSGDSISVFSSNDIHSSIFTGTYLFTLTVLDTDSVIILNDTIKNVILKSDEIRIDEFN